METKTIKRMNIRVETVECGSKDVYYLEIMDKWGKKFRVDFTKT